MCSLIRFVYVCVCVFRDLERLSACMGGPLDTPFL